MKNKLLSFLIPLIIVFYGIAGYHFLTGWPPVVMMIIGVVIGVGVTFLAYGLLRLLDKQFQKIPRYAIVVILSVTIGFVVLKAISFGWPTLIFWSIIALGIACCTALYWFFKQKTLIPGLILGILMVVAGVVLFVFINEGSEPFAEEVPYGFSDTSNSASNKVLHKNPAALGPFEVKQFTYGSGKDPHRLEYASGITYTTNTINGKALIPEWKGKKKKWRERYWKFGPEHFPLNGRVYLPEGEGPFPLVLIVHGNHSMIDYSDDGYGYLGQLLASRGFLTVSIDENFLNGHWSGDFRGKEMPARAWVLLKHLEQWRTWNSDKNHDLADKVDMDNIMIVGHSRGGEAVSIAAAYNQLPYFPDDATEQFDFNFSIKGVVAIAPTDYRYYRKISLENVNFLSIQGSYDADETSFWGMRAYRRLQYTDSISRFKAGVYMHHANHGQFNATWGKADFGAPSKWLLNLAPLLEETQQQEAAKVFISAFAEATLKNSEAYRAIFKDVAVAKAWLPKEHYLTHFEVSGFNSIADFEEDINVRTARDSSTVQAKNLVLWREENLKTRDQNSQENNVVVLGWDKKDAEDTSAIGSYEVLLSKRHQSLFKEGSDLQLTIGSGNHQWLNSNTEAKEKESKENKKVPQIDFTVQLTDAQGKTASLRISMIKAIPKPLKTRFTKFEFLDKEMIGDDWEVQLQTYHLPLKAFSDQHPKFNMEAIKAITFLFDQTPYGVLVLDEIGVSPN